MPCAVDTPRAEEDEVSIKDVVSAIVDAMEFKGEVIVSAAGGGLLGRHMAVRCAV